MAHRKNRFQTGIIATLFLLGNAMPMAAQTIVDGGAVDYNMGAEGLYNMTEFLLVMMHYVTIIVMGIAVLTALVNAFQIYVKMNNQEGDISKSILSLFGACLFLLIATYVFPGFFGIVKSDNLLFGW